MAEHSIKTWITTSSLMAPE